jgi:hypothetical protein
LRIAGSLTTLWSRQANLSEPHDFYKSGLGWQDGLIVKLCGAEQSAPRDLSEAFDRTFGKASKVLAVKPKLDGLSGAGKPP